MLDYDIHQATGLSALGSLRSPRIVALASHGDRAAELPLMWQLCAAWTALNYPVVVLDGHTRESERNPGLQQLLVDSDEPDLPAHDGADWPIVPAALGLTMLGMPQTDSPVLASAARTRRLSELFQNYEVIFLYAPAHELARTLQGSGLSPILAVSPTETTLLTGYHTLKHLYTYGRMKATIVAVMDEPTNGRLGPSLCRHLQDCARDFLSTELSGLSVRTDLAEDMQHLALRTLEHALLAPHRAVIPTAQAGMVQTLRRI
jgi:hypothetical protein